MFKSVLNYVCIKEEILINCTICRLMIHLVDLIIVL